MAGVKGRSGRRPTSAVLKLVHGTARADRINPNAPRGGPALTSAHCPPHFNATQRERWAWVVENAAPGLLKLTDLAVVAEFVAALCEWEEANQKVRQYGMLLKGRNGLVFVNPLLKEEHKLAARLMRASAEIGFSPAARERVSADAPTDGNPFDDI